MPHPPSHSHYSHSPHTYLHIKMLTQQFLLAEGVSGFSREDVHWSLLQLALDGTIEDEQGLTNMLLEKERGGLRGRGEERRGEEEEEEEEEEEGNKCYGFADSEVLCIGNLVHKQSWEEG